MSIVPAERLSTGIDGLDQVLHGGLLPNRAYLVQGGPGSGKSTLARHFLKCGELARTVFITLGESEAQLREDAARSGMDMDGIAVLDLSPNNDKDQIENFNLVESWDIEGNIVRDAILGYVREHRPTRVVIDSLSQMRYLSVDHFQFRKQILALFRTLTTLGTTILFTSEESPEGHDNALPFLSDGIICLQQDETGRRCHVTKFRGSGFSEGSHYFLLGDGGITLFPKLVPSRHNRPSDHAKLSTGLSALDELTHGGLEKGTVTILSGPTGVGKTTLGAQIVSEIARHNERAVIYCFDESESTFLSRCQQVQIPVDEMIQNGYLQFEAVEPLLYNPDQFAVAVRKEVEEKNTKVVMLDSLSGYQQSVRGEELQARIHALCRYLVNMNVTVILVNEVLSVVSDTTRVTEHGLSYIADNVIMLRYIELDGELRKTIGVLKKRAGNFERTLREFEITEEGIVIGPPLKGLRGILKGTPETISFEASLR